LLTGTVICSRPATKKAPFRGKIGLTGKWQDRKTFEANKIYLPPDIKKVGER